MKKNNQRLVLLGCLILLALPVLLTGCTSTKEEVKSQLSNAKLTDAEEELLTAAGIEHYFVFDYQLAEADYKAIRVWVEYYQDGEYQGQRYASQTPIDGGKDREGRLVISLYKYAETELRFVTSVIRERGVGSSSTTLPTLSTDFARTWGSLSKAEEIQPNQSIPIVGVAESQEFATGLDFRRVQEFTGEVEEFQPENQSFLVFRVMFVR